jgi:6-phosphogluconolactonase
VPMSHLIVGAYTETLPHVAGKAEGVLGATYDPRAGTIGPVTVLARTRNPSFTALDRAGRHLYVVNETATFEGQPGGGLTAFARDPQTGALRALGSRSSLGEAPCYLALTADERGLAVANYDSGSVAAVMIEPDGSLGSRDAHVQHVGSSVHPVRQAGPHVHMVSPQPDGDILVVDLGMDAIVTYQLTESGLAERPGTRFHAPPGSGPRHLAVHPDGQHLFVVCEMGSLVLTLRRENGGLVLTDSVSILPSDFAGSNLGGGIAVSASGRHVLASNRGHDSVAMLRFDPQAASLTLVALESAGGACPRDICLTPEGDRLVVANQDSSSLAVLDVDEQKPELRLICETPAPTPSSVLFAP